MYVTVIEWVSRRLGGLRVVVIIKIGWGVVNSD